MEIATNHNEQLAEAAFTGQSSIFDKIYSGNTIVNYKRDRVRSHILQYLSPQSSILEINSGTGEDAIFFAGKGHKVHATDISTGMQQQLIHKVKSAGLSGPISNELRSFTKLDELKNQGPSYFFQFRRPELYE
jgi:ubiquinone/menaquinone biosynthesis C-methylase UbiE